MMARSNSERMTCDRCSLSFPVYTRAAQDHTVRTDEPEEEMFSTTLHLMLAAVTRYAVGLVYIPESGFDAEKELEKMKMALLHEYEERG